MMESISVFSLRVLQLVLNGYGSLEGFDGPLYNDNASFLWDANNHKAVGDRSVTWEEIVDNIEHWFFSTDDPVWIARLGKVCAWLVNGATVVSGLVVLDDPPGCIQLRVNTNLHLLSAFWDVRSGKCRGDVKYKPDLACISMFLADASPETALLLALCNSTIGWSNLFDLRITLPTFYKIVES